jgi:hypothetical protein
MKHWVESFVMEKVHFPPILYSEHNPWLQLLAEHWGQLKFEGAVAVKLTYHCDVTVLRLSHNWQINMPISLLICFLLLSS